MPTVKKYQPKVFHQNSDPKDEKMKVFIKDTRGKTLDFVHTPSLEAFSPKTSCETDKTNGVCDKSSIHECSAEKSVSFQMLRKCGVFHRTPHFIERNGRGSILVGWILIHHSSVATESTLLSHTCYAQTKNKSIRTEKRKMIHFFANAAKKRSV